MIRVRIRTVEDGDTLIIAYGKPDEDFGEPLADNERFVDVDIDEAPDRFHLDYTFDGEKFVKRTTPLQVGEYDRKRYGIVDNVEKRIEMIEARLSSLEKMAK